MAALQTVSALLLASLVAGGARHAPTRANIASPRAVVIAKAAQPAAQSAADKAARAAQSAADKLRASAAVAMAQELTARKQAAQSAADKLHAGTLAGPAAVTNAAQIEQLLVEMRLARKATEELLAETKKTARVAALRWGIENAEMHEFAFKYQEEDSAGNWHAVDSDSGWVIEKILCNFLHGRKHVLNDHFDVASETFGYIGDELTYENEAAFVSKLVEQIDHLIGKKPRWNKKRIIYDNAEDGDADDFEYTLFPPAAM